MGKPSKNWKCFERAIARVFNGKRRGCDFRDEDHGKDDVIHPWFSVECKILSRPSYSDLLNGCRQAELNSNRKEPVLVLKRKGDRLRDCLVVQRLETFREWRL